MIGALLSLGESRRLWRGRHGYDVVIAVNRPCHECDWWSFGDAETFFENDPDHFPAIWTHRDTAYRIMRGKHSTRFEQHRLELYERDEKARWPLFSATAALMLAKRLGITRLDCYGCDMAGVADYDGKTRERNKRSESRWQLERAIWDEAVANLAGAVGVRRILQ